MQRDYAAGTLREKLFGRGPFLPDSHRAHRLEITDSPTVHTHDTARVAPRRSAS